MLLRAIKKEILYTASNIARRASNYLLMILLARDLTLNQFGQLSIYINIIGILILITNFGYSEYILVNSKTKEALKKNSSRLFFLSFFSCLILLILSLIIPLEDKILFSLLFFKLFFDNSVSILLLSFSQVVNKIRHITNLNFCISLSTALVVGTIYLFDGDVYLYFISILFIYVLSYGFILRNYKLQLVSIIDVISFLKRKTHDLKYYGISMVTIPIYMTMPNVIGAYIIEKSDFALHQAAFSLTNIVLLVSTSYIQSQYPTFLISKKLESLKKKLKLVALRILFFNMVIVLFFIIFGEKLLPLLYKRKDFIEAYSSLIILLASNTLFVFASVFAVTMVINKQQKVKSKLHLQFIFVSVISSFILITSFGFTGISYTYFLLYAYVLFRYYLKFNKTRFLKNG